MSKLTFDKEKCAQRNRIAAKRDGVNAFSMKFLRGPVSLGGKILVSEGEIPENGERALELINQLQAKNGKPPLEADQIHVQYLEAANDNFIGDRYAFMSDSTLRNIAGQARDGFAFMNSHRTGRLSQASELPFGKTFAGRYEVSDSNAGPRRRAVLGVYMLKGVHPNGAGGPSTDDLNASIEGGVQADVSVGLWGGAAMCDVCNNNLDAADCAHVPGTHRGMSDDQIAAQKGRGVRDGAASYTIEDANCSEVSAVYDGAVPGAGFKKGLSFAREMSDSETEQFQRAFASLFGDDMAKNIDDEKPETFLGKLGAFLSEKFGGGETVAAKPATDDSAITVAEERAAKAEAEILALRESAAKEKAERIVAELDSVMKDHGAKFGKTAREIFEKLLSDAKLGTLDLATVSPRLIALAAALPPVGSPERVDAGGKTIDAQVEEIAGETPNNEARDKALHEKTLAKQKELKLTGPRAYETALSAVLKDEEEARAKSAA
jgi:hypothetical protein